MKNLHLYTMRLDCPLSAPIKKQFKEFFNIMGCKQWLIGITEKKKESGKEHFHVVCKIAYSENKVRKEFKKHFSILPIWNDPNNWSCSMKKKEQKCILKFPKKFKQDINNIIIYPIKEVINIEEWLLKKDYRGFPKKLLNELFTDQLKRKNKKQILIKKKTRSDYMIIYEKIQQDVKGCTHFPTATKIIVGNIINYYKTLSKKIPYRKYILSLVNSYLLKLKFMDYQEYYERSITDEFVESHSQYFKYPESDNEEPYIENSYPDQKEFDNFFRV